MRLLADLLLLPITGPVRGLRFIAEQFQAEAESMLMDEGRVEAALAELSLRYSQGQISQPEYMAEEDALVEELDSIRAYKEELAREAAAQYEAEWEEAEWEEEP